MRALFLCGSGRSGTTVLRRALSTHPDVATLPGEFRMLTDPGGLLDLRDALYDHWEPYGADAAVHRFMDLVHALKSTDAERYSVGRGHRMDEWVPGYMDLTDDFIGAAGINRPIPARWTGMSQGRGWMYEISPWDRATVIRKYVENLYRARNPDAGWWVDDTPYSGLHAERIVRVFPTRFVLCVRHPLDILHSFLHGDKQWTPRDPTAAAGRILYVLRRMMRTTRTNGVMLRLEDVMDNPQRAMGALCDALDLPEGPSVMGHVYDAAHANVGRRRGLTEREREVGVAVLGNLCRSLGYPRD